jgi:hypothetical protein
MRKSQPRTGTRLVRAGLATAAAGAVVVAGAPTPASAANMAFTISPTSGPLGANTVITVSATGLLTGVTTPTARFVLNATVCPTTLGATSTTNLAAAAAAKTTDDAGTVTSSNALGLGNYRVCIYNGTATTAALEGTSSTPYQVTAAAPVLSATAGPAAGGNQITVTGPSGAAYLTSVTTVTALFTTAGTCPATYTATGNLTATATKTSTSVATVTVPSGLTEGSSYTVCLYNGAASTSALIGTSSAAYSALPSATLSPTVGQTGGGNTITAGSTAAFLTGIGSPGVTFSRTACPATYTATGDNTAASTVTKISNAKVAVGVPSAVAFTGGETTAAYNVCIYGGTGGSDTLIAAPATYTIAPAVTVTAISPSGGPTQGGSRVTITGTGFPFPQAEDTVISVSLGGAPLSDVQVTSSTSITGITTARAPDQVAVAVTTASGTKTLASAYTYSYGITVTPNTAAPEAAVYLDIMGVGFSGLTFGGAPNSSSAHVFLVNDTYSPTADGGTPTDWATPPVTECGGVIPISDNEIICELDLGETLDPDGTVDTATNVGEGTYTVAVVSNGSVGATLNASDVSIISSGSTFTVSPY